jgi:hypothetical protein
MRMRNIGCLLVLPFMAGAALGQSVAPADSASTMIEDAADVAVRVEGATRELVNASRYFEPVEEVMAFVPATGETVPFGHQLVWKPICSNRGKMTAFDLSNSARVHAVQMNNVGQLRVVDGYGPRAGLNLVFVLAASVPAAALPAIAAVESYLEGQFPNDPITVTINVSYASLGAGILGATGSSSGSLAWSSTRAQLVAAAEAGDTIQSSLPSGTTIPVRYSTGSTTNETQVFWTFAAFKAAGGAVSGTDANMQFSTNFPFDYDPSNGITTNTISFRDVLVHEVGHAMGFTSGVGFRNNDIDVLDLYRFRRTDGSTSSDFNPDTTAEFGARPRWAVFNNPNDDVNFDIISTETRMSDGSPNQSSHWREQVPNIGIMDPSFAYGETYYPNYFKATDFAAFDVIGWNR